MIDKSVIASFFDETASSRSYWFNRNYLYHEQVVKLCRLFLHPHSNVLDVGCGTGDLLNVLNPTQASGIDLSPKSIAIAQEKFPQYTWLCQDIEADEPLDPSLEHAFDLVIFSDVTGYLSDVQTTLEKLQRFLKADGVLVVTCWNWLWEPLIQVGQTLQLKATDLNEMYNWVSRSALSVMLSLAQYEVVQETAGLLLPYDLPIFAPLINSLSHAPLFDRLALLQMLVARPRSSKLVEHQSVTVVIPTRNEVGNIEDAVLRTPDMGTHTELLFIDGNSTDGTVEKIHEMIAKYPNRDIKFLPQVDRSDEASDTPPNLMLKLGKGHAVRKAFDHATGDILMILDSDLTVPPEELPKFYEAIVTGKGRFINGTRFVYAQEAQAMRLLNRLGNVGFSLIFSWLLDQRISDTLCGTKVLLRTDYHWIRANRSYFGDFDPFGDFDLLFGAARLGLPIIEVPIRYRARTYGDSKVRVGQHGPLLVQMSLIGFLRFKLQPLLGLDPDIQLQDGSIQQTPVTPRNNGRVFWWFFFALVLVGMFLRIGKRQRGR